MGGRRDDSAPVRGALPPAPAPAGRRGWRLLGLVLGLVLAAGATGAAVFTDDPLYLRVALLAACWAFVVAAFVAGNRRADQVAAAGREAELRHAYDLELEREVAARHAYESELESRVRREAQEATRGELDQLRGELSGLSQLREDLAAVTRLRADLTGLGQLRTELAALTELRTELAGLGELRTDLGRMRTELTEQLSGELLIERMVMRAQSVRGRGLAAAEPADDRTLGAGPAGQSSGADGGWDVDRWTETRVVPAEPAEAAPRRIASPPPVPPAVGQPSPVEWLIDQSVLDQPSAAPSYAGAAYDDLLFGETPSYATPSYETPSWSGSTADDPSGHAPPTDEPAASSLSEPSGHARLEQILTESGVEAPSGGRARRRRYRDEDGDGSGDDVLARVLGRS